MTRDEILKMEAGSELDALVAEKVMGWAYSELFGFLPPTDNGLPPPRCPEYSTYIATAWEVVEKMHESGYWARIQTPFDAEGKDGYWCGFTPHEITGWNGIPDNQMDGETPSLAICRAALLAVMESEK